MIKSGRSKRIERNIKYVIGFMLVMMYSRQDSHLTTVSRIILPDRDILSR